MRRSGYGRGLGRGYKNLLPMDNYIHSLSAKGVKTKKDHSKDFDKFYKLKTIKKEEQRLIKIERGLALPVIGALQTRSASALMGLGFDGAGMTIPLVTIAVTGAIGLIYLEEKALEKKIRSMKAKGNLLPHKGDQFWVCAKIPYEKRFNKSFIKKIKNTRERDVVGKFGEFLKGKEMKELFKEVLDYDVMVVNKDSHFKGSTGGLPDMAMRGGIGRYIDDFDREIDAIFIRNDMTEKQTIKTLVHEGTHGIQRERNPINIETKKDFLKYCKRTDEEVADRFGLLLGEK